jgi:hypothetical protein
LKQGEEHFFSYCSLIATTYAYALKYIPPITL